MKNLLASKESTASFAPLVAALSSVLVLSSCNDGLERPSVPKDRVASLDELEGAELLFTLEYGPNPISPEWASWLGVVAAILEDPDAGAQWPPLDASIVSGFDHVETGCLSDSLPGSWWRYDVASGGFSAEVLAGDETAPTLLRIDGRIVVHSRRVGVKNDDGHVVDHEIETEIMGTGTWTIAPGGPCGGDDFAGGLVGEWRAREGTATGSGASAATAGSGGEVDLDVPRVPIGTILAIDPETGEVESVRILAPDQRDSG